MVKLDTEERQELHSTIIRACQVHGFTTDHTHELVDLVIDSITNDSEGDDISNGVVSNQLISTLAMVNDPRLRRLFSLVGEVVDWGTGLDDVDDGLLDVLLDLAPEYLPPDDPSDRIAWWNDVILPAQSGDTNRSR